MPWCNKCGAEYLDGVEVCSNCNIPLKAAPGLAESPDEESEWVVITKVPDITQAKTIYALLKSAGIPAMVRDRHGALKNLYGNMSFLEQGVEVYVHVSRLDEAQEFLKRQVEWTEDELVDYMERTGELEKETDDDEN